MNIVLFRLEPIGVDGGLEAVDRIPFCSTRCRGYYAEANPDQYAYDRNDDGLDEEVCEWCDKRQEEV